VFELINTGWKWSSNEVLDVSPHLVGSDIEERGDRRVKDLQGRED